MNSPALDLRRFLAGCVLGVLLGILYGGLRPPRRKHPHLCDLLFMAAAFYSWLYLSFALCDGDIRLVYSLSLPAGILLEEWTLGRLLRPVFAWIWKIWDGFLRILLWPWKIFFEKMQTFCKFSLCNRQKMGYNILELLSAVSAKKWRHPSWPIESIPSAASGWYIVAVLPCSSARYWQPSFCPPRHY